VRLSNDDNGQDAFDLPNELVFRNLERPKLWYWTFQIRSVDGIGQEGEWSERTTPTRPAAGALLPPPTNVTIWSDFIDDITFTWDQPSDDEDPSIEHDDIEGYQAQIFTSPTFEPAELYKWDKRQMGDQKIFKIRQADRDNIYYGRIRSFDAEGDFSQWIPAKIPGNSDPNAAPDGVNLRRDLVVAVWDHTRPTVKHYRKAWTATRRFRYRKARVVCGSHDPDTHPLDGTPGGSALEVNVWWHSADGESTQKLFDADDRLKVDAGTHKDTNAVTLFNRKYIDNNESMTVKVGRQGDTRLAEDVVIQVIMEPVFEGVPDVP
jgi:hypothetical protein